MRTLRADLHVHTALSPCGGEEMSPPAIVDAALAAGLDMIAVCDHNAARQRRRRRAGRRRPPGRDRRHGDNDGRRGPRRRPLPHRRRGGERRRRGACPSARGRRRLHALLRRAVPDERPTASCAAPRRHALALATPLRLDEAVALIKRYGGLAVAAHIDRPTFGVDRPARLLSVRGRLRRRRALALRAARLAGGGGLRRLPPADRALVGQPLPRRRRLRGDRPHARRADLRRARARREAVARRQEPCADA